MPRTRKLYSTVSAQGPWTVASAVALCIARPFVSSFETSLEAGLIANATSRAAIPGLRWFGHWHFHG